MVDNVWSVQLGTLYNRFSSWTVKLQWERWSRSYDGLENLIMKLYPNRSDNPKIKYTI